MGKGYLKVQLRVGYDFFPVADTKVLIKDKSGNTLYELITDENGNTEQVLLEAPDIINSLTPDAPGPKFGIYDVVVPSSQGYKEVIVRNVEIFDTEIAILPVTMIPIVDYDRPDSTVEVIDIPTIHGIDMNTPYSKSAALLDPRVIRSVFIPTQITVHLGLPNAAANNVTVPFIDYIKNVASSEIFPTWPEAALEANIYAIISFALNRVYTLWYRSRGFAFDITNSTSVDQYFVYGRNIFQNISLIVDRIFNTYINRVGREEPFFAQFCNGTTSTCDGLSQWGTVPLAERGYTPIQILREYYPNDIRLVTSTNFSSEIGSYPGTPLQEGSSGNDVLRMQNYLNRISANYPLIPQVPPTGVFTSAFANAVRVFQRTFNLVADGIIGMSTWYKITYLFVAVTGLAELESEGIRISIGAEPPTSVVSIGARGADVVELQFLLNFISQFYNNIPTVIQDSVFRESTKRSVTEFQKEFGLTPDGVVGPATWNKLYEVYKGINNVIPPPPPEVLPTGNNPPFPGTNLAIGSRGDDVLLMQRYLNVIAGANPSIPTVTEDGIFGPNTELAVRAFQNEFGLYVGGIIGNFTWNRIVAEYNRIKGIPISPEYPGTPLKVGSRGEDVLLMQQYLNIIATFYSAFPLITADGIFGPNTEAAVRAFQSFAGIPVDGIIGPITWNSIVQFHNTVLGI